MRECDGVDGWMRAKIRAVVVNVQVQKFNDLMNSLSSMAPLRSLDPLFLLLPWLLSVFPHPLGSVLLRSDLCFPQNCWLASNLFLYFRNHVGCASVQVRRIRRWAANLIVKYVLNPRPDRALRSRREIQLREGRQRYGRESGTVGK